MFSLTLFLFGFAAANSLALSSDGNATIMQDSKASLAQALPATSLAQSLSQDQKDIVKEYIKDDKGWCSGANFKKVVLDAGIDVPSDLAREFTWYCQNYVWNYGEDWTVEQDWTVEHFLSFLFRDHIYEDHAAVITEMDKYVLSEKLQNLPVADSLSPDQKDIVKQFVEHYFKLHFGCRAEYKEFQHFETQFNEVVTAAEPTFVDDNDNHAKVFCEYIQERREREDQSEGLLNKVFAVDSHQTVIEEMRKQLIVSEFLAYFNTDEDLLSNFTEVMEAVDIKDSKFDLDQIPESISSTILNSSQRSLIIQQMEEHLAKAKSDWKSKMIMVISIAVAADVIIIWFSIYLSKKLNIWYVKHIGSIAAVILSILGGIAVLVPELMIWVVRAAIGAVCGLILLGICIWFKNQV